MAIGTLMDPPPISAPVKAIVDVHNDNMVAIAPISEYDKIAVAVMQMRKRGGSGLQAGRGERYEGGSEES